MGNELQINDNGILRTDTELARYIKDFLINRHNFTNNSNLANYLKKRACCTNQRVIPISLPRYDTTTNKVYPTTMNVRVFEATDNMAQLCNFADGSNYHEPTRNTSTFVPKAECSGFYNNFCSKVKDGRANYTSLAHKRYGPYRDNAIHYNSVPINTPEINRLRDLNVTNQFYDCNCENSVYQLDIPANIVQNTAGGSINLTQNVITQNFDTRCSLGLASRYYLSYDKIEGDLSVCINNNTLGYSNLGEEAALNVNQVCNLNNNDSPNNNSPTGDPTTATPTKVVPIITLDNRFIDLNWTRPTNVGTAIINYKTQSSLNGTSGWSDISTSINTFIRVPNLSNGTTYYFRVTATTAAGNSSISDTISGIPRTVPDQISNVVAIPNNQYIDLTWTTPFNGGSNITGYRSQWSLDGTSDWRDISTSINTFIKVPNLMNNVLYYYRVFAKNVIGDSLASVVISATPSAQIPPQQIKPSKISSIVVTPSSSSVRLFWNAPFNGNSNIINYVIQKSSSLTSPSWTDITTSTFDTSYNVTGLTNDTTYYFKIYAINSIGPGEVSDVTSGRPISSVPSVSSVPSAPIITAIAGDSYVDLSWNVPNNGGNTINNYTSEMSINSTNWTDISTSINTNIRVSDLSNGRTYYFRIYATSAIGPSLKSNIISIIPRTQPTKISSITIVKSGDKYVELSWTAPYNGGIPITNYKTEISTDSETWTDVSNSPNSTKTSIKVSDLTNGTKYYFRVTPQNQAGFGLASDAKDATPALDYILIGSIAGGSLLGLLFLLWLFGAFSSGRGRRRYYDDD